MPTPDYKTILVVDDFEPVCEMIELLLGPVGYRVFKAANGAEAMRFARAAPIDLLLCNLNMPKMRGDELAVRIVALHPSVPVVFLSSRDHPRRLAVEHNVLHKPFTVGQLRDAVSHAIRRHPAPSGITSHLAGAGQGSQPGKIGRA